VSDRPPELDDLVGAGLEPAERERLQRVHELLIAAGPPPELAPELTPGTVLERGRERDSDLATTPRRPRETFPLFPRRRWAAAAALAAALGLAAFGAGFLVGNRAAEETPERTIGMAAPAGAGARASLALFPQDDAGNWPMELTVRGLPTLPEGATYELWLTKGDDLAEPCGTFVVRGSRTVVPLNAPYRLRQFDGWVVVRSDTHARVLTT
jgi:Anti-sigma-K factor rskA